MARAEIVVGECDIYLWGLYPHECNIDFQKEFVGRGVDDPSLVKITHTLYMSDVLIALLTLGFYQPVSYEISVYTKQEKR